MSVEFPFYVQEFGRNEDYNRACTELEEWFYKNCEVVENRTRRDAEQFRTVEKTDVTFSLPPLNTRFWFTKKCIKLKADTELPKHVTDENLEYFIAGVAARSSDDIPTELAGILDGYHLQYSACTTIK